MKGNWTGTLLLLVISGIVAAHCQSPSPPAMLKITAEHPSVKAGSDIWIDVVMTNTSAYPIDCSAAYSNAVDLRYEFHVWGPDGIALPRRPRKHPDLEGAGSISLCTLKPDASTMTEENLLNRLFDMNQPGAYSVQLSRTFDTPSGRVRVSSNKVQIQVSP